MFPHLKHTSLPVYGQARDFVLECYKVSRLLPSDERFNMVQQIRRAGLSVHLNIAEGCSRHSPAERNRYFEVSRGSLVEIDAALDIACALNYVTEEELAELGEKLLSCYKQLSALIQKT